MVSENPPDTNITVSSDEAELSALKDNIARKGKNAYYYAHAHSADGPKWDGKPEPKLLSKHSISVDESNGDNEKNMQRSHSCSFDAKSTITSYAFCDEETKVKIYVNLVGVGEKCKEEGDITLDHTAFSFVLYVHNYAENGKVEILSFARLFGKIESANFKKKPDKLILTLVKSEAKPWPRIGSTGTKGTSSSSDDDF